MSDFKWYFGSINLYQSFLVAGFQSLLSIFELSTVGNELSWEWSQLILIESGISIAALFLCKLIDNCTVLCKFLVDYID